MARKTIFSFTSAFVLIISVSNTLIAGTIKGHILDSKNKEALIGATVFCQEDNQINATAGLDGSYIIKNVKEGIYTLNAKFFGYAVMQKTVVVGDSTAPVTVDFMLSPDSIALNQVKIVGEYDKGSDNYARNEEKTSDMLMNIMSAKTIQLLPDITIGDVLQRVSGVVAQQSVTGGGKYATIRGMDKQYNYTTIDGVTIPSPDYGSRYVPMNIFPAEMVERLEVIKTLMPDNEGDAIGGAMNLVLKDAPDQFLLTANISTGYNGNLFNKGFQKFDASVINLYDPSEIHGSNYKATVSDFPTANINYKDVNVLPNLTSGFVIGNRFFGSKLGVLASASYQNMYSATEGMWIKQQSQPNYSPEYNTPEWDYVSQRYYSTQQSRMAGHIKLDYVFSPKHKISFYTVYAQMNEIRSRIEQDTANALVGSELNPHWQSKVTYQHIFNSTLKGSDTLLANHLALNWTMAYANAWENTPDWDDIGVLGSVGNTVAPVFSSLSRVWMQSTDQDFSGYVNLTYDFKLFGQKIQLKAGAMNRDKSRNAYYNEYDFSATPVQPTYPGIDAILANPNYYVFVDPLGMPQDNNSYSVQENVNAYYGMAKVSIGHHVQVIGGVREENTNQAYQDAEPAVLVGKDGAKQYTDILPSIELKYSFNENMTLRGSYFASLARPSFIDIIPYQIAGDQYTQVGNSYLKHTTANNYDLRFEWYPKPSDQLLVGVFYKQIYNPIELAVLRGTGPSSVLEQPINIGGDSVPAINYGVELAYTKALNRNFEISANYTYTHSSITVSEQIYGVPGQSKVGRSDTTETRPLQGQVDHIANLSLIYKAPKYGLEAEVSVVYTGKAISDVSLYDHLDQWQMPMTKLDFSFEKRLSKKIRLNLYGKINNILNTPYVVRLYPPNAYDNKAGAASWLPNQDTNNGNLNSIIVQKETYGQSYLIGLRYKF